MTTYKVYLNGVPDEDGGPFVVGYYYTYKHEFIYDPRWKIEAYAEKVADDRLMKEISQKKPIAFLQEVIKEENLDPAKKQRVYRTDRFTLAREPQQSGTRFVVYRAGAEPGEKGYSPKKHSVPHCEGHGPIEGMEEWARWYYFNKMDDGTYQAELDEAWYWGGPYLDGGTITRQIPEEWFDLPYEEFLEEVLGLAAARHFLFTVEDLMEKPGLKQFFGF